MPDASAVSILGTGLSCLEWKGHTNGSLTGEANGCGEANGHGEWMR